MSNEKADEHASSGTPTIPVSEAEQLRREISRLEEQIKERDTSFYRALKTLAIDGLAYARGKRDFPQAALLGAIFAYISRRAIVLLVGSLSAVFLGGVQIYLLFVQTRLLEGQNRLTGAQNELAAAQNQLLEKQNEFFEAQTAATRLQAISALVSTIDTRDPVKREVAVAQIAEHGRDA